MGQVGEASEMSKRRDHLIVWTHSIGSHFVKLKLWHDQGLALPTMAWSRMWCKNVSTRDMGASKWCRSNMQTIITVTSCSPFFKAFVFGSFPGNERTPSPQAHTLKHTQVTGAQHNSLKELWCLLWEKAYRETNSCSPRKTRTMYKSPLHERPVAPTRLFRLSLGPICPTMGTVPLACSFFSGWPPERATLPCWPGWLFFFSSLLFVPSYLHPLSWMFL